MPEQKPKFNRSDLIYGFGGQICGLVAMYLKWDDGYEAASWAAIWGTFIGAALLMIGCILTGHPPSIFTRIYKRVYNKLDEWEKK